jgi:hypothetical protein
MTEWEIKTAYVMMTEQKETKRGKMQWVTMAEQERERRQYKSLGNAGSISFSFLFCSFSQIKIWCHKH